ncbi:hypothetical protein LAZ67_18001188 [Cordylochernes scorpioides]|uniref:Peptidase aspartic putative domain-containing protein n=1 Tax=Cordylochernes scorpioides TaxID=51811 RepID=A0ABY6LHQ2_9ARAC|nr:hypothetical protein LAZ67_18001188 [Cordylochernes scorpioides]
MSSHLDVMCTKLILDRDVMLPTLRVTLKGNRTEKTARAIIDTGSQRSYILHSTAMEMEYEQSLFGGSSTDVVEHEVYTIHLSDINNSYRCEFEALGQPLICGSIPPVCPRSFLEGSEKLDVSDLRRDRIEVLIGADIAGRLLTDAQKRISSGLVAIRTKLGWTVMGKIPPTDVRDDTSSLCVTTLLSLDLENLWKLDAIGVSDAEVEKKTQSLQAEMEEYFAHTTTRDIEGRYEVALHWVQDKERIPSNRDLAENQLSSVRRKLEEVGDMKEYRQIFEECINQGIIEYSREDKLDGVHNRPHRPVYKRNSQTSKIRPVFNASARKRNKLSLNDSLDKGPNLIEIIPRLLNKFRKYELEGGHLKSNWDSSRGLASAPESPPWGRWWTRRDIEFLPGGKEGVFRHGVMAAVHVGRLVRLEGSDQESCSKCHPLDYIKALEEKLGKSSVFQIMKMSCQVLVELTSVNLAERLVEEGFTIGTSLLKTFPYKKRAEKITIGNLSRRGTAALLQGGFPEQ